MHFIYGPIGPFAFNFATVRDRAGRTSKNALYARSSTQIAPGIRAARASQRQPGNVSHTATNAGAPDTITPSDRLT